MSQPCVMRATQVLSELLSPVRRQTSDLSDAGSCKDNCGVYRWAELTNFAVHAQLAVKVLELVGNLLTNASLWLLDQLKSLVPVYKVAEEAIELAQLTAKNAEDVFDKAKQAVRSRPCCALSRASTVALQLLEASRTFSALASQSLVSRTCAIGTGLQHYRAANATMQAEAVADLASQVAAEARQIALDVAKGAGFPDSQMQFRCQMYVFGTCSLLVPN